MGVSLLLVCTLCPAAVTTAFAANTGDTAVSLLADDANISVTVPLDMSAAIEADGTLTYPTNAKFINNSVFGIHVSNIAVVNESPYTVIAQSTFDASIANDVLWTSVAPGSNSAIDLIGGTLTAGDWNMAKSGVAGNELALSLTGKVKNLGSVPTTATKAYTITWTVSAGTL